MRTFIKLKNIRFFAYHGVLPEEKIIGNEFVVNVKIKTDFLRALQSDDVKDTLNYAHVYDLVKAEMQQPSDLLEHVAGRIFNKLKAEFPQIDALEVRLAKLNPPVGGEAESAEIVISDWHTQKIINPSVLP